MPDDPTVGDVIEAAREEWDHWQYQQINRFQVRGEWVDIDRFSVLLLCRLAEAGLVVMAAPDGASPEDAVRASIASIQGQ